MDERKDIFDKRLKELMDGRQEKPSAEVWARIEQTMAGLDAAGADTPEREPVRIVRRRKPLGVRRMWYYGVAAALLLGIYVFNDRLVSIEQLSPDRELAGTVLYDPASDDMAYPVATYRVVEPAGEGAASETAARNDAVRRGYAVLAENVMHAGPVPATTDIVAGPDDVASATGESSLIAVEHRPQPDSGQESQPADNLQRQTVRQDGNGVSSAQGRHSSADAERYRERVRELMAEDAKRDKSGGRMSASLYASNLAGLGSGTTNATTTAKAGMNATELVNSDIGTFMASSGTQRLNTETSLNHQVPITVGLSAQYELTDRWALETGVTYTYMHSRAESKGIFDYDISQELHYVGVPLAASYKIVDTRRVEVYVKAGGAVERCVSARRVYKYMNSNDDNTGRQSEKIDYDGVQMSTFASVGAELKLGDWVGIYAEPGVGYFFDNDQPSSYRTDNPLSVTLQAGLRFHFGEK